jgi:hypothetical protein
VSDDDFESTTIHVFSWQDLLGVECPSDRLVGRIDRMVSSAEAIGMTPPTYAVIWEDQIEITWADPATGAQINIFLSEDYDDFVSTA